MIKENFREYDIVIFGASGLIGHSVIEEIAKCMEAAEIKWAIASRNFKNLREALVIAQDYLGNRSLRHQKSSAARDLPTPTSESTG
ncbi:hypothetical protein TNCV_4657051 [Trichonephila clavipes]|nr:hypothetical protein TNCV_4657051 [Trichonephila clavipes]